MRALLAIVLAFVAASADALDASARYRSPRNPERRVRASTELIVLHTTEAPAKSSLNKVSDRGECHYVVTEDGSVYGIVDRDREAFHAGRSMWNGREDVDKFSLGIECVGYHDKMMPAAQLAAIHTLVKELQRMYRISDDRVVCHSHVAYGAPNKWHRQKHRGRKRCGMLFAMPSIRAKLGLCAKPAHDRDVLARRLVVGDPYLHKVLYGGVDTMRGASAPAPSGGFLSWLGLGSKSSPAAKPKPAVQPKPAVKPAVQPKPAAKPKPAVQPKPAVKPVAQSKPAARPKPIARPQPATLASPKVAAEPRTVAELRARGYVQKGVVNRTQSASKIVGRLWNAADTYYVVRGKATPGNKMNASHIELGTAVWRPAKP